ncbi:MAG: hypothetical protein ACYC6Y_04970 [Thermoguttaceae bacterium]
MEAKLSTKTVRKNCIECSGGSQKAALWCPCDGLHSTVCPYWSFRLGMKPATVRARYGGRLVSPEKMPPAGLELELLPDGFQTASTVAIDLPGYHQPAVTVERKPGRNLTPEQRQAAVERLRKARAAKGTAKDGNDVHNRNDLPSVSRRKNSV